MTGYLQRLWSAIEDSNFPQQVQNSASVPVIRPRKTAVEGSPTSVQFHPSPGRRNPGALLQEDVARLRGPRDLVALPSTFRSIPHS